MNDIRIVFMGTPSFASVILSSLIENNYNVILVVSQPDKEMTRKRELIATKTKSLALKNNIKVFQPEKIRLDYQEIIDSKPDLIITCAYGQFIPDEILALPKYGSINVHASLLPKYRGGAPIQRAIINGEKTTGITIMYMDSKMDAGDIISTREIDILDTDTSDVLFDKLSKVASSLLLDTIPSIIMGTNNRIKQNEDIATYGYNITKEEELINFNDTAVNIHNKIRGLSSNPGAYTYLNGKILKVYGSMVIDKSYDGVCGEIKEIDKYGIIVKVKDKSLCITDIKLEGKSRCSVSSYLNGIKDKSALLGTVLGDIYE